ncbi:hypothetical protein MAC_03661 [Metarhizium acridum CQMa 102]|uniref:Uncharacterized protein n=1 Tax=Metarhizium acridum (strain CQMa 102) TaxID=655827 RepID=E9E1B3_METAQ|nr:uncharacterized protein MAC_03661 [Metarhizium acridum CQMa 102]EFY90415.1 hypothetical protein MAC_03661 [Metarhizium acridum CQMa 102]
MAPYHTEWEEYVKPFRKNRRLLVARNIDFNATRAEFEDNVRAKLTKPGSVIFLWPPAPAQYNSLNKHTGSRMLGSSAAAESESTEQAWLRRVSGSTLFSPLSPVGDTAHCKCQYTPSFANRREAALPNVAPPNVASHNAAPPNPVPSMAPAVLGPATSAPRTADVDLPEQSTSGHGSASRVQTREDRGNTKTKTRTRTKKMTTTRCIWTTKNGKPQSPTDMTPHGKYQELFAKTQFNNHEDDKHSGLIWSGRWTVHAALHSAFIRLPPKYIVHSDADIDVSSAQDYEVVRRYRKIFQEPVHISLEQDRVSQTRVMMSIQSLPEELSFGTLVSAPTVLIMGVTLRNSSSECELIGGGSRAYHNQQNATLSLASETSV